MSKDITKGFYRVISASYDRYQVVVDGQITNMIARKKTKQDGKGIVAGDWVTFSLQANQAIIESIRERYNFLLRPKVANIDAIIAVVAQVPKPDYLSLDKLSYNCVRQGIEFGICINKTDIDTQEFLKTVQDRYSAVAAYIVKTCAKSNDIVELQAIVEGKLCCLAGQSAVGKSSLVNCILQGANQVVGELSQKAQRGRHTTTQSQIFFVKHPDTLMIDTPGFGWLGVDDIDPAQLQLYLPDFDKARKYCKFGASCTHTAEPDCGVTKALDKGKIDSSRYQNYCLVYGELLSQKKY